MRFLAFILALGVAFIGASANADAPKRVLALGGAVTETVYALGAGNTLVGVDQTSVYPAALTRRLPNVGYVRALAAEGLLSLKADLVLAGPEAGPPEALAQAASAGLRIVHLEDGYSTEAAIGRIAAIGAALDRKREADALIAALNDDLALVKREVAAAKSRPRVLFLLQAGGGAPKAAGRATAADAMIALAGGVNAVTGFEGYKPLSPEAGVAAAPEILVMMKQSVDALGGEAAVFALPELAGTPAIRNRRLVVVDALYGLGFGPRMAHAAHDLAVSFHSDAKFPPLPARPWMSAK
jgi:iron complex transport system substrate-binding protein